MGVTEFGDRPRLAVLFELLEDPDPGSVGFLEASLSDADPAIRRLAVRAVQELSGESVVPLLVGALADEDTEVADTALIALRELRSDSPALVRALDHPLPRVRAAAAIALRESPGREPHPSLRRNLADPDALVRIENLSTLLRFEALVASELVPLAETDPSGAVRRLAVEALGGLSDSEPGVLERRLADDEDWQVRREAARSLGNLESAPKMLISALDDNSWQVVKSATESLARRKIPEAASPLSRLLDSERSDLRQAAILALAKLGALDRLASRPDLAEDSDAEVRRAYREASSSLSIPR
jgi:HEAT repeat protein